MKELEPARRLQQEAEDHQRAERGPRTLKQAKEGLYDRIGKHVSVSALNGIIFGIMALILLCLIIGIALGN